MRGRKVPFLSTQLAGMDPAVAAERLEHSDGGALFHKTYRHLYEGEKREQAKKLEALVLAALDEEGTPNGEETPQGLNQAVSEDGRYWARTSDPQLRAGALPTELTAPVAGR